jgi:hypothetical protein
MHAAGGFRNKMAKQSFQPVRPDFNGQMRLHALLDLIIARELSAAPPVSGAELLDRLRSAPESVRINDTDVLRLSLAPLIDAGIIEEKTDGNFWFTPLDSMRFRLSQLMLHLIGKYGAELARKSMPSPAASPPRRPAAKGKR